MTPYVSYGIICMVAGSALLLTSCLIDQSRSGTNERTRQVVTLTRRLGLPALVLIAAGTGLFLANMFN